jgi:hypothetical membrane protein
MKNKSILTSISGFTAVFIYLVFTMVSFLIYPSKYNPLNNWLSDLGNPLESPSGAIYYNLGCIVTAVLLILLCIGLRNWDTGSKRIKVLLAIARIAGILAGVSLIIAALFPLGTFTPVHEVSSKLFSVFLGFFLAFLSTVFLRHPAAIKWYAGFGFLTALVNFIYGVFLYKVFIAEWISLGLFIIFILMVSYNSLILKNKTLCLY